VDRRARNESERGDRGNPVKVRCWYVEGESIDSMGIMYHGVTYVQGNPSVIAKIIKMGLPGTGGESLPCAGHGPEVDKYT